MSLRAALLLLCVLGPALGPAAAHAEELPLDWTLHGYWKARWLHVGNLFLGQASPADVGRSAADLSAGRLRGLESTDFFLHQMRLSPSLAYGELATLKLDADVLDGVVWGDNAGLGSLALFAGSPSANDAEGRPLDTFAIRRAWLELDVKIGSLRVGRMPSHWGMGLLANKGDGLDADFGDFNAGSSVDRILFLTKPARIVEKLLDADAPPGGWTDALILGLGYDKTVSLARKADEPLAEELCSACPPQILLARPNDDVDQFVGVLMYKDDKAELFESTDLIQAGLYVVHRTQKDTRSQVTIVDGHLKLRLWWLGIESELLYLGGQTEAIDGPEQPIHVDIKGGVIRPGFYTPAWLGLDIELELGFAPGDPSPTDQQFTGYPFHSDYNVGLLLYDYVLATRTARYWGRENRGLWSKGGVWNSLYVQPKVRWRVPFVPGLTVVAAYLFARADADNAPVWYVATPPGGSDLELGHEIDLSVRYDFYEHVHLKLETGVFFPGRALWRDVAPADGHDLEITSADAAAPAWTVQLRLGFVL